MPLEPQRVAVDFTGGLDTDTDSKLVIPGKLLELQNARFTGTTIESRPGTEYVTDTTTDGATLTDARHVVAFGNELLRWTSDGVFSLPSGGNAWTRRTQRHEANPVTFSAQTIAGRVLSCESWDCATLGGVNVYAWAETERNEVVAGVFTTKRRVRATVTDAASGAVIQDSVILADAGDEVRNGVPRVVACGASILVFYGSIVVPGVVCFRLTPSTPGAFSAPVTLVADGGFTTTGATFGHVFDVQDASTAALGSWAVMTYSLSATSIKTVHINNNGASPVVGTPSGYLTPKTETVTTYTSLRLKRGINGIFYSVVLTLGTGAGQLRTYGAQFGTPLVQSLGAIGGAYRMAMHTDTATGTTTALMEPLVATSPLIMAAWSTVGVVTTSATPFKTGLRIAGPLFVLGGHLYLTAHYNDTHGFGSGGVESAGLQPTIFIVEVPSGVVVARVFGSTAGGPVPSYRVPDALPVSSSVDVLVPTRRRREVDDDTGQFVDLAPVGLALVRLMASDPGEIGSLVDSDVLHVGGGLPALYDGGSWVEDGFNVFPEGMSGVETTGGFLSAGTYSWVLCYEWVARDGTIHRSAPSAPVTLSVSAGAAVDLTVPLLMLTTKRGVRFALFRTQANGTVYQRVFNGQTALVTESIVLPAGADTTVLTDFVSDTDIADNEVIYATGPSGGLTGGELHHRPPPPYTAIVKHQEYLFTNAMDDAGSFAYSLPSTSGEGVAWADELFYSAPADGGRIVGFGVVDDTLVIACRERMFAINGRGPGRDGGNSGFSEPRLITGGVGCASRESLLSVPDGLMTKADAGYFLLTRGLETVRIGAAIQAFLSLTISGAVFEPTAREVRYYSREGTTLVYSLNDPNWSTWTNQNALGAALRSRGVVAFADGVHVRVESADFFTEAGTPVQMVIGTSWLKWAGIHGAQRVWNAFLVGDAAPSVAVTSETFVDFEKTAATTRTQTFLGSGDGGPESFVVREHLNRQFCKALRFRWTVQPTTTDRTTGRVGFTSLALEFGVARKASRRATRSI